MASLVIKNLPNDLHVKLKKEAERHRRSMTQQAVVILQNALRPLPPLAPIKPIKPTRPFSHQWLLKAMKSGRE